MKKFTFVKEYGIPEWGVIQIASYFEQAINDYIESHWAGVNDPSEVPLEIRQNILRHIVDEMLDPDSTYEWDRKEYNNYEVSCD